MSGKYDDAIGDLLGDSPDEDEDMEYESEDSGPGGDPAAAIARLRSELDRLEKLI